MIAVRAPAKLNLRLAVLARETSGYHQIETLFCALELADTVEVEAADRGSVRPSAAPAERDEIEAGVSLEVEGASLGAAEDNLAYRAAVAFFERIRRPPRARIRLRKRIPAGAGLGGGSSDAAATLMALQRLHGEPIGADELLAIGGRLGSDVPFFLANSPLALAWGRGQRLLALPPLPVAHVLLALPDQAVRTADAYEALDELRGGDGDPAPELLVPGALRSWEAVAAIARNDFERVVFERIPALSDLRDALEGEGAAVARLTGTGSAVFGVYRDAAARAAAAAALRDRFERLRLIATETVGPPPDDG